MDSKIKRSLKLLAMPFTLLLGYALVAIVFFGIIAVVAVALGWLLVLNLDEPSAYVIGLDIFTLAGLGYVLSRPKIRSVARELWKQLFSNL